MVSRVEAHRPIGYGCPRILDEHAQMRTMVLEDLPTFFWAMLFGVNVGQYSSTMEHDEHLEKKSHIAKRRFLLKNHRILDDGPNVTRRPYRFDGKKHG